MKPFHSLSEHLEKVALTPEPPPKVRTPPPMRTKVVCVPTRSPIDRQAALLIARPPWWAKLEYDVPNRPPPTVSVEELRGAHQQNAALAKRVEQLREQNRELKDQVARLTRQLAQEKQLRQTITELKHLLP